MSARRLLPLVAAALVGLLVQQVAADEASAAWFGTWTLNLAKSTEGAASSVFRRGTCTIAPSEDGWQFTYELVRIRGGITHLEWRGRLDGRDYPVAGIEVVVTSAYTRVDDRTLEIVQKTDGQVAATARMTLSADGTSFTTLTTTKGQAGQMVTATTVYDRSSR